ncbi:MULTISPECIES: flavin reductase [unclassified Butyrivibrio]|uniref:flavin reductase n=1 Tax=unclassified Butyrivibrio TaxID=2639466 RepID=UPI000428D869|nr:MULTISPECIES: flavin reductase [unclassified Butyrivibrio]
MGLHVFQPVELDDVLEGAFRFGGETWALLTAGNENKANTMTVSWGGITYVWDKTCAIIYVRESRYTKEFIDAEKKFSLSFLNHDEYRGLKKYLGSVSGRDEDKIANAKLNLNFDDGIPFVDEADNVLICKVLYRQQMKEECVTNGRVIANFYDKGNYHWFYIAEIKKVMIR